MTIREQLELREIEYLSPYATLSKDSRGRESARKKNAISVPSSRGTGTGSFTARLFAA